MATSWGLLEGLGTFHREEEGRRKEG